MYLSDIEVEILVGGKPVKKFTHKNQAYIQANISSPYSIRVKNNSFKRRKFIVTVDGLNVVDGKIGDSTGTGYIINGYSSYEIPGFRTSNTEVHPFKFANKEKSYAAKSEETEGDTSDCGVIGILVFEERQKPQPTIINQYIPSYQDWGWPYTPYSPPYITWCGNLANDGNITYSCNSAPNSIPFPENMGARGMSNSNNSETLGAVRRCNFMSIDNSSSKVNEDLFNVGTEFSKESVSDIVSDTEFDTGELIATVEIFYSTRDNLVKMGVPVFKQVSINTPRAFPGRFCKPPIN